MLGEFSVFCDLTFKHIKNFFHPEIDAQSRYPFSYNQIKAPFSNAFK